MLTIAKRPLTEESFKHNHLGWGLVSQREPLLSDLWLLAEKLEKLGFRYNNGKVTVVDPEDLV